MDLSKWLNGLAVRFPFADGWLMTADETLMVGEPTHFLENPEQWSTNCPPQQTFARERLFAVLTSVRGLEDEDSRVTFFLQRDKAWKNDELEQLQDQALIVALQLGLEQHKDRLEVALQQAQQESKLLGLSHMAVRLGKNLKECVLALDACQQMDEVREQARAIDSLVEQLLAFTRRPSGTLERISLHKVLQDALRLAQPSFEERGALVSLESPLPVTILGRPLEVRKLVGDLLQLALASQSGPEPYLEVQLHFDANQVTLDLSFEGQPGPPDRPEWHMCEEIARHNQGELQALHQPGEIRWSLRFPLAADATSETTNLPSKSLGPVRRLPYMCVTSGALAGSVFRLEQSEMHLGRAEDCAIVAPYNGVSRRHAVLEVKPPNQVWIRDLNSTNGTFVNDQQLSEDALALAEGDTVRLGPEFEIVFGYR